MKPLDELKTFFESSPLTFMRTVPFNEIIFDNRCKFLCKYGCKNFRRKYCCPPDALELKEEIQKNNYQWALLAATSSQLPPQITEYQKLYRNRQKEHEIQKISINLHDFFIKNDIDHIILSGGACKKCQICSKILHQKCKKPKLKLTSMEAVGIDCQSTLTSAGFDFEMPAKKSINRCTAVLLDCDDFSSINWKKYDSNQTFKKVSEKLIRATCEKLTSENSKMFESIDLISTSDINQGSDLCNGCNHVSKNFACPPYSDKIDLTMWDRCIVWKWNINNVKKYSYNRALRLIHTSLFSLGLYYALSVRDCYCDECQICEYEKCDFPVCNFRKIMSPSMQSQGINPNQFGNGKYGLEFI